MAELIDTDRRLTPREREVLTLAGSGLSERKIAARLFLAPSTVGTHLDNVRHKFRVHTTREAALIALDAGLIPMAVPNV